MANSEIRQHNREYILMIAYIVLTPMERFDPQVFHKLFVPVGLLLCQSIARMPLRSMFDETVLWGYLQYLSFKEKDELNVSVHLFFRKFISNLSKLKQPVNLDVPSDTAGIL